MTSKGGCVCVWAKWADWTEGQQSTLFLGPIKSSDIKIVQRWPSQDLSVTLREAMNLKVTHLQWWKGWCLMIFKKEQVMTKISLAVGRWHSVSLAFVRLVQGLHQQTCEALCNRLILAAITLRRMWQTDAWLWCKIWWILEFSARAQLFIIDCLSQWIQIKKTTTAPQAWRKSV